MLFATYSVWLALQLQQWERLLCPLSEARMYGLSPSGARLVSDLGGKMGQLLGGF